MTYIVFKQIRADDQLTLINALCLSLLVKEDNFDWETVYGGVAQDPFKLNDFELISHLLACEEYIKGTEKYFSVYTIVRSKKKLQSDKVLVSTLKTSYVGCIIQKLTKKEMREQLITYKLIYNLRELKRIFVAPPIHLIKYYLPSLKMTNKEIEEWIAIDEKQERKVQYVLDEKIAEAFSKLSNKSILIKNF